MNSHIQRKSHHSLSTLASMSDCSFFGEYFTDFFHDRILVSTLSDPILIMVSWQIYRVGERSVKKSK